MSAGTLSEAQSDAAVLARIRNHWTPRIIQAGSVYVGGFQVAYLWHDYAIAPQLAFYLHLLNLSIALGGLLPAWFRSAASMAARLVSGV